MTQKTRVVEVIPDCGQCRKNHDSARCQQCPGRRPRFKVATETFGPWKQRPERRMK